MLSFVLPIKKFKINIFIIVQIKTIIVLKIIVINRIKKLEIKNNQSSSELSGLSSTKLFIKLS